MVAGSYSQIFISPVSPTRLWKASMDTQNLIPKLIPNQELKYVKTRIVAMDNENYVFKFGLVEGRGVGTKLKSCIIERKMEATSEGGTKTTVKMDYDTLGNGPLSQEEAENIIGGVLGQTKAIEGHLQANPYDYA
ncbi:pathogenesis-related protein STH-2-like [Aristolochia californica]|uniref:pathogenesis-related protein STH-2-like n=1 Tax=Aristolochia californica TaxID=171875 RepID=UPI0035DA67E5